MLSLDMKEKMYDLAFRFWETGLWKHHTDQQLFAVQLPDGQIGYCSVMGRGNRFVTLEVHVGQSGINSYYDLLEACQDSSSHNVFEILSVLGLDSLQCAYGVEGAGKDMVWDAKFFAKKLHVRLTGPSQLPCFFRQIPMRRPEPISEERDAENMMAALRAALFVSMGSEERNRRTGGHGGMVFAMVDGPGEMVPLITELDAGMFRISYVELPEHTDPILPDIHPADEETVAKVRKCRPSGIWECAIAYFPEAGVEEDPSLIPSCPLAVDARTATVLLAEDMGDFDRRPDEMYNTFLQNLIRLGERPASIRISRKDRRAEVFFSLLARQLGIPFRVCKEVPALSVVLLQIYG